MSWLWQSIRKPSAGRRRNAMVEPLKPGGPRYQSPTTSRRDQLGWELANCADSRISGLVHSRSFPVFSESPGTWVICQRMTGLDSTSYEMRPASSYLASFGLLANRAPAHRSGLRLCACASARSWGAYHLPFRSREPGRRARELPGHLHRRGRSQAMRRMSEQNRGWRPPDRVVPAAHPDRRR